MRSLSIIGIILIMSGLVCFGAGGYLLFRTLDDGRVVEERRARVEKLCKAGVVKFANWIPQPNDEVEILIDEVLDPRKALGDASAILALCPHRNIAEACLGVGCGSKTATTNVRMTLKLSAPSAASK